MGTVENLLNEIAWLRAEKARLELSLRAHIEDDKDHDPCPYCLQEKRIAEMKIELEKKFRPILTMFISVVGGFLGMSLAILILHHYSLL
jgi:hypothetical protein